MRLRLRFSPRERRVVSLAEAALAAVAGLARPEYLLEIDGIAVVD